MANMQDRSDKQRQQNKQSGKAPAAQKDGAIKTGPGRGWHGDSEGHARAGAQSHKNR